MELRPFDGKERKILKIREFSQQSYKYTFTFVFMTVFITLYYEMFKCLGIVAPWDKALRVNRRVPG